MPANRMIVQRVTVHILAGKRNDRERLRLSRSNMTPHATTSNRNAPSSRVSADSGALREQESTDQRKRNRAQGEP